MEATLKTASNWVLKFSGFQRIVPLNSPLASKIEKLIKDGASDQEFLNAIDISSAIKNHESGLFGIEGEQVFVLGEALPRSLSDRVLDFAKSGLPFQPLLKLWDRCKANPDPRAKTDLYAFLEQNGHPITMDGCFIAYRYVQDKGNGKFVDAHTGTMDNSIGMEVTMRREDCDPNPAITCSRGLHCAAFEYATSNAGSGPVVEVKVDPADVVAIPLDYNGQKMRVCRFKVMCLNKDGRLTRDVYDSQNITDDNDDQEDDEEEYDDEEGAESHPMSDVDFSSAPQTVNLPSIATAALSTDEEEASVATIKPETRAKLAKHAKSMKRDKHGHFIKGSGSKSKRVRNRKK